MTNVAIASGSFLPSPDKRPLRTHNALGSPLLEKMQQTYSKISVLLGSYVEVSG
jgi:hypothetical protein